MPVCQDEVLAVTGSCCPGEHGPCQLRAQPGPAAGGRVALITGPVGVGKSTIGFRFYPTCLSAGLTAGYVDLGQIGFLQPLPRHSTGRTSAA
jgi:hypothetical protein